MTSKKNPTAVQTYGTAGLAASSRIYLKRNVSAFYLKCFGIK